MQWKSKHTRPELKHGTTRLRRVFAWLPKYIDGVIVWLETYEILQVYETRTLLVTIEGESVPFKIGQFTDVSERLCK